MQIERLKRWHWTLLGAAVGALLGWGRLQLVNSALQTPQTIGPATLSRCLSEPPLEGHPIVRDLIVHPGGGGDWATMQCLPDQIERSRIGGRRFRYSAYRLTPHVPFLPAESPDQTVQVRIEPGAVAATSSSHWPLGINGERTWNWPERLQFSGWKTDQLRRSDPQGGAEISIALRPATYQLRVLVDAFQAKSSIAKELKISMNGHELAPLARGTGAQWQTRAPAEFLVPGDRQVLKFARTDRPVLIRRIELEDPNFTLLDYLNSMKQKYPHVRFQTAWWEMPRFMYPLWAAGGALVLGGVWPSLLAILIGAGLGRARPREPEYDLSRFKGEPRKPEKVAATDSLDESQLAELEAALRQGLSGEPIAAAQSQPAAAPVASLGTPDSPPVAPPPAEEQREYRGEYYPVARSASEKKEE